MTFNRSQRHSAFMILVVLLQVVFYASFLKRADIRTSDFPTYYSVARLWQQNLPPYSLAEQCKEQARIINSCFPLAHPPFLLLALVPVVNENFTASFWRWLSVLAIALMLCLLPLYWLSCNLSASVQCILMYSTVLAWFYANDVAFVLLGMCLWVWLMQREDDMLAGWALSLALLKPQFAVILALPLLFSRWRVFWGFCEGAVVLVLLSFVLVGADGFRGVIEITKVMAQGQGYGIGQVNMINVTGIVTRAGLSPFWSWPFYFAAIAFLCWLWRKYGVTRETISIGIVCALFFAPHAHNYDMALLAIPLLFAHRLGPLIGSLVMIVTIPFVIGYVGFLLLAIMICWYSIRRLTILRDTKTGLDSVVQIRQA